MKNRDQINEDFCRALIQNNREELKHIINPFLLTLDSDKAAIENFEAFKLWIEKHDCVKIVEMDPDLLDSDPPIKQFYVLLKDSSQKIELGIKVTQKKFLFSFK